MPRAINKTFRENVVLPEELCNNPEESKQQIANLLNMTVEEIDEKLNANWVEPNLFVPLKTVLPTDTNLLDQLGEIDGVMGNEVTGRYYPLGEAAAHLVGYVGQISAEELKENDYDR